MDTRDERDGIGRLSRPRQLVNISFDPISSLLLSTCALDGSRASHQLDPVHRVYPCKLSLFDKVGRREQDVRVFKIHANTSALHVSSLGFRLL